MITNVDSSPLSVWLNFIQKLFMKNYFMLVIAMTWSAVAFAQYRVEGTIKNQQGQPLLGSSIQLLGTKMGAYADVDGFFSIENVPGGIYKIRISFIGFKIYESEIQVNEPVEILQVLVENPLMNETVTVYSTRAREITPTTFSNVEKQQLTERNLGQDLPQLLNFTPSMVTTSDAGAGIGYTGMRIRGSDGTRINVTVNGVPINDSESHGVFWVNMPDLATSVNNIQIQRGVGTSSNGGAAFGATVNLQTNAAAVEPYVQLENTLGSFNTFRNNISINSGLLDDKYNFEGRLSRISSDGYIDRSASDLKSFYFSGGMFTEKTMIKLLVFGGREITQQAWYGTPQARIFNDEEGLQDVLDWSGEYNTPQQVNNLLNSDRRFNYYLYDNEVDHYSQDHYQLHVSQSLTDNLSLSGALHYTKGMGYFEQYRENDRLSNYNLSDVIIGDSIISRSDIIRRRWLDNDFYGLTYAFNYQKNKTDVTLGGGYNIYEGLHFGEIVWAEVTAGSRIRDRYYEGEGKKLDFNSYLKVNHQLRNRLNLFGDIQLRTIDYKTSGTDNDLSVYDTGGKYLFFNPKAGLTFRLNHSAIFYASYAIANREPVRSDFIDALDNRIPAHETLYNLEAGIRKAGEKLSYEVNYFLMQYKNQLVLTGALNDVGSSVRTNVDKSYRTGIEIAVNYQPYPFLRWSPNVTFSQNKINQFTEILYNYAFEAGKEGYEIRNSYKQKDISFSPAIVAASDLTFSYKTLKMQFLGKYVSQQYLDNTANKDRSIDAYFINDLCMSYEVNDRIARKILFTVMVNNLMNVMYESNGYTWGYLYDSYQYQQNNYYPQAGRNFLAGITLQF